MKNKECCPDGGNSQADFGLAIKFLKVINEPNRLKIICLLRHGERCVCEIWKNLDLPQNLVSHHLKALKDFDLIDSKQVGRKVIYQSNKAVIKKYTKLLNKFLI